ncbi:hypothetical protein [Aliiroseovarius subalbicans]|uniref:hypothetical protein n=1 Tax=Aliiroseovarius subalbicans TaxID=2925840 RepID=UPI001F56D8DC|nr:hypothetical protein [Aliiroseovarius subalbicans]MCI2398179.1 hypothetical protein [Aliiroseovarius subalbicans]
MLKSHSGILAISFGTTWLALVVFLPAGLWVPDETVIYASVESLRREGSLVVDNGYSTFQNHALLFNDLLKVGPRGAVVQYPSGYAVMLVPFSAAAGLKGMMVVNAVSAAVSVWLTFQIALLLFGEQRVAFRASILLGLCSFLTIYAKALWPHALSTSVVLAVSWFALRAVRDSIGWRKDAVMSGLVLGLGLSVRVDVVLIAPALLAVTLFLSPRPTAVIATSTVGFLPGMLLASWFNHQKFGTLSPVSYGSMNGSTSLASYGVFAAAMIVFLALCLVARHMKSHRGSSAAIVVLLALLVSAIIAIPVLHPMETWLKKTIRGIFTLWFDMRLLDDESHQVTRHQDGTLTVFGLYKKAVAQSMPWIGILATLVLYRVRPSERLGVVFCFLAIVIWTLPFASTSWHGGFAANMRYFLPVIPFLCMLAASALDGLPPLSRAISFGLWIVGGAITAVGIVMGVGLSSQPAQAVIQHTLPLIFFSGLVGCTLFSMRAPFWAGLTRLAFAACVFLGLVNTYAFDLTIDIMRRVHNAQDEAAMSSLPQNSLIYAMIYEPLLFQIRRGDPIAARNRFTNQLDPGLVKAAQDEGFTVYVQTDTLRDQVLAAQPEMSATQVFQDVQLILPLYRLDPAE